MWKNLKNQPTRKTCRTFRISTVVWLQPPCCHILVLQVFFNPFRNQEVFWFCLVSCVLWCLFLLVQESAEELSHPTAGALMGTSLKLELWGLLNALHDYTDYLCFGNKGKTQLRRDSFAELAHDGVFILVSEWWPCSWMSQVPSCWMLLERIIWDGDWSKTGLKIANKFIYSAGHKQESRVFNTRSNIAASL